jgi:hypothetical protein
MAIADFATDIIAFQSNTGANGDEIEFEIKLVEVRFYK